LHDPTLTDDQVTSFIDVWRTATADPSRFAGEIERSEARRIGDWWDAGRGPPIQE